MSQSSTRGAFLGPFLVFLLLGASIYFVARSPDGDFIASDIPDAMREAANHWLDRPLEAAKVENTTEREFDRIIKLVNQNVPEGEEHQRFGLVVSTRLSQHVIQDEWPRQSVRQAFHRLCALGRVRCRLNQDGQFVILPK